MSHPNRLEYDRCHDPLGMENFGIGNDQISASSEKSATTPAATGRRNAVRAFGLDGAWCAAVNDQVWTFICFEGICNCLKETYDDLI